MATKKSKKEKSIKKVPAQGKKRVSVKKDITKDTGLEHIPRKALESFFNHCKELTTIPGSFRYEIYNSESCWRLNGNLIRDMAVAILCQNKVPSKYSVGKKIISYYFERNELEKKEELKAKKKLMSKVKVPDPNIYQF